MKTNNPARWFRMYAEFATDPKVQMLPEVEQRRFVMLLCLRCGNGDVTLQDSEVAFQLRVSSEEWADTKAVLMAKNLIDESSKPVAWDKRQYASDSSAARVAKHRANKKRSCNVTVTPPETETETETEIRSKDLAAAAPGVTPTSSTSAEAVAKERRYRVDRGSALEADWFLPKEWGEWAISEYPHLSAATVRFIADKFRDHWIANSNQREGKKSDWKAAWRNWVRRDAEKYKERQIGRPPVHAKLPPVGVGAYGETKPLTPAQRAELERQNATDPIF